MKKTSGQECLRFEFLAQQARAQLSTSIQICVGQHLDGLTQGCLIASTFLAASSEVTCFVACLDVDAGGVDLLVALTLEELFTVTKTVIL